MYWVLWQTTQVLVSGLSHWFTFNFSCNCLDVWLELWLWMEAELASWPQTALIMDIAWVLILVTGWALITREHGERIEGGSAQATPTSLVSGGILALSVGYEERKNQGTQASCSQPKMVTITAACIFKFLTQKKARQFQAEPNEVFRTVSCSL